MNILVDNCQERLFEWEEGSVELEWVLLLSVAGTLLAMLLTNNCK